MSNENTPPNEQKGKEDEGKGEQQPPTDENGLTYVVITDGSGPFETGEILVCAPLPGAGVREIGYPSRKPLKFDSEYERFGDPQKAIARREKLKTGTREWVRPAKSTAESDGERPSYDSLTKLELLACEANETGLTPTEIDEKLTALESAIEDVREELTLPSN